MPEKHLPTPLATTCLGLVAAGGPEAISGGLYDNLGPEPIWRDHAVVLVSDAGPTFRPDPDIGRVWRHLRYAVTLLERATEARNR